MKGHKRKMENSEKRNKVIDELTRRKKIVEEFKDLVGEFPERFGNKAFEYCARWNYLIGDALKFVKKDLVKDKYDYSDSRSFIESAEDERDREPAPTVHESPYIFFDFYNIVDYIGRTINSMNGNYYPEDCAALII